MRITGEQAVQARVASAPDHPAGMLHRQVGDGQAELLPFRKPLLLRRLQEQLGRSQVILLHQRQPLLDQGDGIPASLLEDAGIHCPQVRRHHQTAGQHQQTRYGAEQEPYKRLIMTWHERKANPGKVNERYY